mgnify:CR=1 FL=1
MHGPYNFDVIGTVFENFEEPFSWTEYNHDLTEVLTAYTGQTLLIGISTENSWAATYNGHTWFDDVHMIAD